MIKRKARDDGVTSRSSVSQKPLTRREHREATTNDDERAAMGHRSIFCEAGGLDDDIGCYVTKDILDQTSSAEHSDRRDEVSGWKSSKDSHETLRPAPLLGPLSTSVTTMFTPTSVDAIRAAPGPCVTLYQRPEIRAVESNFSLPWTRSDIDQEQAATSSVSQDLLSRRNRPHPHRE
ncbi:uncharacterized protein K489DRAFT_202182 [Dissoconium aciculare CBS 342.82]|uniref:Uncharacterized protein n=1 Tax=Dissoconium aciculare CBS 342.82 TaxID=1314786 RepID=A0A6J3M6E7_9PEZI|nr:uncharacterized protein K489DRAFT_202182 [Dissoconium aciculare CBS 342.82]KAF1823631.1 hypothetical protein K489DRAFT_202182 [Dissoconium aciculare CBS 342.82]